MLLTTTSCATHLGITFLCATVLRFLLLLLLSVVLCPSFLMSSSSPLQSPANFCSFEIPGSLAGRAPGYSSLKSFHPSGGPSRTHAHPRSFMADLYAHESHQIESTQACSFVFQSTLTITPARTCHTLDPMLLVTIPMQARLLMIIETARTHIFMSSI